MFVNKDDDDDDDLDSGDNNINDHDKQDNSHNTIPWKGDNLNICLPIVHYQHGCCNCELDLREWTCSGADPGFFKRGCTLLLVYFNTNKPHIFFWQNTSCIRKPQVISGGGRGGFAPSQSPPRSAPDAIDARRCSESLETSQIRTEERLKYSVVQEHLGPVVRRLISA